MKTSLSSQTGECLVSGLKHEHLPCVVGASCCGSVFAPRFCICGEPSDRAHRQVCFYAQFCLVRLGFGSESVSVGGLPNLCEIAVTHESFEVHLITCWDGSTRLADPLYLHSNLHLEVN